MNIAWTIGDTNPTVRSTLKSLGYVVEDFDSYRSALDQMIEDGYSPPLIVMSWHADRGKMPFDDFIWELVEGQLQTLDRQMPSLAISAELGSRGIMRMEMVHGTTVTLFSPSLSENLLRHVLSGLPEMVT